MLWGDLQSQAQHTYHLQHPRCSRVSAGKPLCRICTHKEEVLPRLRTLLCCMWFTPALRQVVMQGFSMQQKREFVSLALFDEPGVPLPEPFPHQ